MHIWIDRTKFTLTNGEAPAAHRFLSIKLRQLPQFTPPPLTLAHKGLKLIFGQRLAEVIALRLVTALQA